MEMTVKSVAVNFFNTFAAFAPFNEKAKFFNPLWNYMQTIRFKMLAIEESYLLIINQENILYNLNQDYLNNNKERTSYREEAKQISFLDAFLSHVYSLTETIAKVNIILYPKESLPWGFHSQREVFIKRNEINDELSKFLGSLGWYDAFREIRTERTHFGTAYLFWNPDLNPSKSRSFLAIDVKSYRDNKVLNKKEFMFDFKDVEIIKDGVFGLVGYWSKIMIKEIDPKTTISASVLSKTGKFKKEKLVTLKDVLSKKENIKIQTNLD